MIGNGLGVNLWSNIYGIKIFLPLIKDAGEGHVMSTSSSEGLQASAGTGAYNVSKFGIVALAQTLSQELKSFDSINVSVLCPGPVRTSIIESERHRPKEFLNSDAGELGLMNSEVSKDLLAEAMDPVIVADRALDPVLNNKFWVVTHDETLQAVLNVANSLVKDGSLPTSVYDFS